MRPAGVRIGDGRVVWVDAGEYALRPLDRVDVETPQGLIEGEVFVAPEQLQGGDIEIAGRVSGVRVASSARENSCGALPGAEMPYLGERGEFERHSGVVVGIDAVRRLVQVRDADGAEHEVQVDGGDQGGEKSSPP